MKTHPELFAWLFLLGSYALFIGFVAIVYHRRSIRQWVAEWRFALSEIYHGTGKRWNDHG